MRHLFLALLPFCLMGCVSVNATEKVSISQQFILPGTITPSEPTSAVQVSVPVDMSSAISKLDQFGTPSLSVISDTITGNLSSVQHLEIDLVPSDTTLPDLVLVNQDVNGSSTVNQFPIDVSGDQLLQYLAKPVSLRFTATGHIPVSTTALQYDLTFSISEQVNKGL